MNVSRILVTGATGFVGKALCPALLESGHVVRRAVRQPVVADRTDGPAACARLETAVVGDITAETNWAEALASVDVVIHLAARVHVMRDHALDPLGEFRRVNVAGSEHLARAAAEAGVKRIVFVSSIKVNGEETQCGRLYRETDVPAPRDAYGVSKWEAEVALRRVAQSTGLELVIMRPPLVYGPGVKGNFAALLDAIARGVPLPLASVRNLRDLVYVENFADAIAVCATHPAAAGQTYLVCDGEPISTPALLRQLAAGMGAASRLVPCPPSLLRIGSALSGKSDPIRRLIGSLRIDDAKMRADLNWAPPRTLQEGLRITAEWRRAR